MYFQVILMAKNVLMFYIEPRRAVKAKRTVKPRVCFAQVTLSIYNSWHDNDVIYM